ncbi:putative reverse transcriptase domain-containing protein [Tanacetum coccineum]
MSYSEDSMHRTTQWRSPYGGLFRHRSPGEIGWAIVPEEPQAQLPLDFVLELVYPEFMPAEDESPGYILESDPKEDPKEDDEDPKEDPADYPANRDNDKEEEEEPSGDDADDEDEDEDEDEEEEEKHPAPADSIPSPPLPVPPPVPVLPQSLPTSPTYQLGYQAVMIRLRAKTPFTSHTPPSVTPPLLPIPAPISSPPVLLPSIDRMRLERVHLLLPLDRQEVVRADYRFVGTIDDTIKQWRAEEVGYEIRDAWVDPREAAEEVAPMTLKGVNTMRVEALVEDRQYHYKTTRLLDQEALVSREAWGRSMEVSPRQWHVSEDYCITFCRRIGQQYRDGSIMDRRPYPTGAACVDFDIDAVTTCHTRPMRKRTNPDSNIVTGTFLLNNRYASILFDTGADRSFVSTAFSSQMDITPSTLDHYYDVELADGRIIGLNTILRGCTLNLLNHPFNINLMPVELGSFDAIIGMDWLAKYQAIIVCAEKIVRIPWGNETLIVHDDGSNRGYEARLHIISYSKTQEYMLKGCPVFLAHVTTKEVEDKSEKKRLEDVPIVRDFPEVFPEDFPGLPPTRQEEFQIDLVPGAAPVARAPHLLAPSEMKELS